MLPLFPEGNLGSAVTTTVWVGVWIVAFYNLRLGWSVSGLVVPGYLVPLILVKPVAAGVIVGEGVLTYLIVKALCDGSRVKPWTSFFGRDRFFALVVVSVLVRCVMDVWALPWVADLLTRQFDWKLVFRDDLHSFGLIIVSLVANYLWKPGVRRGLFTLVVTIATTFLIVRFVLIEYTNFSVGNLQYMYEDVAASLLASPKAYIVLITTAYIASWMNLHYGWEFSGILIPALLALQWHVPWKIATTFGETFVILAVASLVLKIPPFNRMNMEGSRKTLLFFNIAFVLRLLLGHLVPGWFPDMKVTDFYGFGYLLSTLLAVRIHAQGLLLRIPRVSLQVSLVGAIAGSLIGFMLTALPRTWMWVPGNVAAAATVAPHPDRETLVDRLRAEKPRLYRQRLPNAYIVPTSGDLAHFDRGLTTLMKTCQDGQPGQTHETAEVLDQARSLLRRANFDLSLLEERFWVLSELEPARGWGMYVIDHTRPQGLLIEVPAPIDEWGTAESGTSLLLRLEGGSLAVAGSGLRTNADGSADVLRRPQTMFALFHRAFQRGNVLQVRGTTPSIQRRLEPLASSSDTGTPGNLESREPPAPTSGLWVKRGLPKGLDLREVESMLGRFPILWQPTPAPNILRDMTWTGHAELLLTMRDRGRLQASMIALGNTERSVAELSPYSDRISAWLLDQKRAILPRGVDMFVPPREEVLLYFDEEILRPLAALSMGGRTLDEWADSDRDRMAAATAAAAALDYHLNIVRDASQGADFLVLAERLPTAESDPTIDTRNRPSLRGWGTYVFRLGDASDYGIEVPRPLLEQQTFEYGIAMSGALRARIIMLAGAHPQANLDNSADVTRTSNAINLFNLVRQVVLREAGARAWRQVQIRALSAPADADVLLAPADPAVDTATWFAEVVDHLKAQRLSVREVDGAVDSAGYESDNLFLERALRLSTSGQALLVWLSPAVRTSYRRQDEDALQAARFTTLNIPTVKTPVVEYLGPLCKGRGPAVLSRRTQRDLIAYLDTRNIVVLRMIQRRRPQATWTRVLDSDTARAFLVMHDDTTLLVIRLAETATGVPVPFDAADLSDATLRRFLESPAPWLEGSTTSSVSSEGSDAT